MEIKKSWLAWLGIAALAFGIILSGCDGISSTTTDDESYLFKFRVDNYTSETITKIEFINGDLPNDKVLSWTVYSLAPGARSSERRVSGFTIEHGENKCIYGVKVTYTNDPTDFGFAWDSAEHESKITVSIYETSPYIRFSPGNW